MASVKILVADDHDLMRRGLKTVLEEQPGWEVCAEAHTGKEAVEKAEETQPDVAILDINMPGLDGLQAARLIRKASVKTEILALSMHCSDQLIRDVIEAGVRGYVTKSDSDRDLIGAVKALASHRPFFNSQATQLMLTLNTGHASRAG